VLNNSKKFSIIHFCDYYFFKKLFCDTSLKKLLSKYDFYLGVTQREEKTQTSVYKEKEFFY
jgi:hypothetical protein